MTQMSGFTFVVFPGSNLARAAATVAALPGPVDVIVVGRTEDAVRSGWQCGGHLHLVGDTDRALADLPTVVALVRELGSTTVVLPADGTGAAAAPALAWELGAALLTDCVAVTGTADDRRWTRRRAGSDVLDDYSLPAGPAVVTVAGEFADTPTDTELRLVPHDGAHGQSTYDGWLAPNPVGPPAIADAELLVGIGRGVTDVAADSYQRLAALFGAEIAATRQAIEWQLATADRKLGDTGLRVAPRTYLTLGVSGANQHLSGIWGNCSIIAVNHNPHAAIFDVADIGVVADAADFLPVLRKELEVRLGVSTE
jgi:electron transfer flavoprotein alpha subunit